MTIVEHVARARGAEPTELEPLYETIDCDALEALVASRFQGSLKFVYEGCAVTVQDDGSIEVFPLDDPEAPVARD